MLYKGMFNGEEVTVEVNDFRNHEDDIPDVTNTEAAKAVIGAMMGEAETLIGSTIEWTGFGYMCTGWALTTLGQMIREHGVSFKRKHYTTLDRWSRQ